ncbi:hypothetical protein FRB90_008751 [Tulasnella sp. 427]|nr:hypothetical protein FRB90_008751 [Tulasnella sp. 427]
MSAWCEERREGNPNGKGMVNKPPPSLFAFISYSLLMTKLRIYQGRTQLQHRHEWSEPNLKWLTETLVKRNSDVEAANQARPTALADALKTRLTEDHSLADAEQSQLRPLPMPTLQPVSTRSELDSIKMVAHLRAKATVAETEDDLLQVTVTWYKDEALSHSADLEVLPAELDSKKARNALNKGCQAHCSVGGDSAGSGGCPSRSDPLTPPSVTTFNGTKIIASPPDDRAVDKAHQPSIDSKNDDYAAPASCHSTGADVEAEQELAPVE